MKYPDKCIHNVSLHDRCDECQRVPVEINLETEYARMVTRLETELAETKAKLEAMTERADLTHKRFQEANDLSSNRLIECEKARGLMLEAASHLHHIGMAWESVGYPDCGDPSLDLAHRINTFLGFSTDDNLKKPDPSGRERCPTFVPGKPHGDCESDGHFECKGCRGRKPIGD